MSIFRMVNRHEHWTGNIWIRTFWNINSPQILEFVVHFKHVLAVDPLVKQVLQVGDIVPQLSLIVQLLINVCKVVCNVSCTNLPINSTTALLYFPPEPFYFLKYIDTPLQDSINKFVILNFVACPFDHSQCLLVLVLWLAHEVEKLTFCWLTSRFPDTVPELALFIVWLNMLIPSWYSAHWSAVAPTSSTRNWKALICSSLNCFQYLYSINANTIFMVIAVQIDAT